MDSIGGCQCSLDGSWSKAEACRDGLMVSAAIPALMGVCSGLMEQDTFMTDDTVNHQGISCDPKRNYKHYLKEFKEETGVSITEQGSTVTKATESRGQR